MIRSSLAGLGLSAILAVPALAQPTQVAVVYDATTGNLDEVVIPDNDAELTGALSATLNVPNGVEVLLPISQVKSVGFVVALASVAPAVPSLQAVQAASVVQSTIQRSAQESQGVVTAP